MFVLLLFFNQTLWGKAFLWEIKWFFFKIWIDFLSILEYDTYMMILNLSYKKNDHGYRVWHHHGRWRCWPIETGSYIPVARGNYTCMVDVNICIWISMYQYVIIISFKGDDPLFTSRWIVSTYENNLARLCNTKVLSCTQTVHWYYSCTD